mmetsp:Transcript_30976/g.49827  ORF Transcript_30976/g.49827 Transcript_30976/m.49827 type:complete len:495 (+) Transcript_30976:120-1604(+)
MHSNHLDDTPPAVNDLMAKASTEAEAKGSIAMELGLRNRSNPLVLERERKSDAMSVAGTQKEEELGRTPDDNQSLKSECYEEPRKKQGALFFVSVGTFKKPLDIFRAFAESAAKKGALSFWKTFVAGIMAGMYIGAGGLFSIVVGGGMPGIMETDPGVQRLAFAAVFPVGLLLCKVTGAELWTGNASTMATGFLNGKATWKHVLYNWSVAWISNFLGSIFFAYFFVYLAGVLDDDPYLTFIKNVAVKKIDLDPFKALLRGIGANWLVCLATTLGTSAQSVTGKMLGIWFPITAFVAIGYEHSVANMFLVPIGLMYGARGGFTAESFFLFVGHSLIPVTFGNMIGGAVFVSMLYHVYLGPVPFGNNAPRAGHQPHGGGHGGVLANYKNHMQQQLQLQLLQQQQQQHHGSLPTQGGGHYHNHYGHQPPPVHPHHGDGSQGHAKPGREGTVSVLVEQVIRHNDAAASKEDRRSLQQEEALAGGGAKSDSRRRKGILS